MSTSQGPRPSPHGGSPFPTFREPQRAVHGQSTTPFQGAYSGQPRHTASNSSFHQRRSPPLAAQIVPGQIRYATSSLHHTTGPDDRTGPHPSPIGAVNRQSILHQMTTQQDHSRSQSALRHRVYQTTTSLDSVPHPARPRFMSLDSMTPELIAKIDLAHSMSVRSGMSGVAYAGGALSGPVSRPTQPEPRSLPNESTLERARSGKSLNPAGQSGETPTTVQSRNTNPCDQDRETLELHRRGSVMREPPQRMPSQQPSPTLEVQRINSPKFPPSHGDPSDQPTSYKPGGRELRSVLATAPSPSPPVPHQNVFCPEPLRPTPHSIARIPDRSLPIQEESPTASSDPVAAYDRGFPHSLTASHSLPGSSIPPNPHSHTTAPSPSPIVTGMSREKGKKPVLPPYSPVQGVDSSYPNPFEHIRRRSNASSDNETTRNPQIGSMSARERLSLQMQTFALNNRGMISDSTLSPSSRPFPGPRYNPWTFLHACNAFSGGPRGIADEQASTRSRPSHQPVPLPPIGRRCRGKRRRQRSQDLRQHSKTHPPPRVGSTQPRDTSPELSSGEETSVESTIGERQYEPQVPQPAARRDECADDDDDDAETDDGKWVDEDLGVERGTDCLLDLEFHPDYVGNVKKRRQRWKVRWKALLHDFHALDRETNTTFVLLAAPSHTGKLHSVASRTVRRDSSLKPTEMKHIRSAFAEIAARQHAARTPSLLEQFSQACLSSYDGPSSSGGGAREGDLRRALDTAIGSLHALGTLYERREMRWAEEKLRLDEDNDRVQLLLKQVLGPGVFCNPAR